MCIRDRDQTSVRSFFDRHTLTRSDIAAHVCLDETRPQLLTPAATLPLPYLQNRDRFTHRYCLRWEETLGRTKGGVSCEVNVTPADAIRTLYDSRDAEYKEGLLKGGRHMRRPGLLRKRALPAREARKPIEHPLVYYLACVRSNLL